MKKVILNSLAVLLAVILVFGGTLPGGLSLPDLGVNASALVLGDLTYEVANNQVTITDCNAAATWPIVIPPMIDGFPVTAIGDGAFGNCYYITSVTIPVGVTSIGDNAFCYCYAITNVTIPEGVTSIGQFAFSNCVGLLSISIPSSIRTIDDYTFINCTALTRVIIPDGVTSIGYWAFAYCTNLQRIHIPSSVTTIEPPILLNSPTQICSDTLNGTAQTYAATNAYPFVLCANHCPICGASWQFSSTVDIPATCTTDGSKSIHCSVCTATKDVTVIAATGHTIVIDSAAVAATCTQTGLTEGSHCSVCNEPTSVQTVIPMIQHATVTDVPVDPTCTETGLTEGSHCSACNAIFVAQEEIPALDHDLVPHAAQAATCTVIGWDAYDTCSRCDYTTYAEIPALNHDLVPHAAQAATCTVIGWDAYDTCSMCDYTMYAEIPATGHTAVTDAPVAPTCTVTGLNEGSHCSVCNAVLVAQTVIPAKGHNFGAWVSDGNATFINNGTKTHTCPCGETENALDAGSAGYMQLFGGNIIWVTLFSSILGMIRATILYVSWFGLFI